MNTPLSLRRIGDSRRLIMGFATLWVAFFHSKYLAFADSQTLQLLGLAEPLAFLRTIGNCGVDFFLFLSGFGLYHSLSRDGAVLPFYGRRFRRVLPATLIVSILVICAGIYSFVHPAVFAGALAIMASCYFIVEGIDLIVLGCIGNRLRPL